MRFLRFMAAIGMVAAAGAPASEKTRMPCCRPARPESRPRLAADGRFSTGGSPGRASSFRTRRRLRPVTSATSSFRSDERSDPAHSGPAERGQALDQRSRRSRFRQWTGCPVRVTGRDRCCHPHPNSVVKLGRKAVRKIVEDVFARRDIDVGRSPHSTEGDVGKSTVEAGFLPSRQAARSRHVRRSRSGFDGLQERRRLHRRDGDN